MKPNAVYTETIIRPVVTIHHHTFSGWCLICFLLSVQHETDTLIVEVLEVV
jgi:hypothetical protein